MALTRVLVVAVASALPTIVVSGEATSLRGQPTVQELQTELLEILRVADDAEAGSNLVDRLERIEASLGTGFQAMPKNEFGRLAPRSVHYLVHSFFMKEHGWLIKGLEPQGFHLNVSDTPSAHVLKDHVPLVLEQLLESRHANRGLSLGDVVSMVALMERLILEQTVQLLHTAYEYLNMSATDLLDEDSIHAVLTSYLILVRRPTLNLEEHNEWVEEFHSKTLEPESFVAKAIDFEKELFDNTVFERRFVSNPFEKKVFSFEAASRFADRLMHQYGRFQNEECNTMKQSLMALDESGEGLVSLKKFYLSSEQFGFWESPEYLREVGALDESMRGNPRVRIANYVLGPSNCIANSNYFSVCCLDECKAIQSELEGAVKAPHSTPERLLRLVSGISSHSVDAPRELSNDLQAKLKAIADHHGGQVPLHGRLFTQWLHFAFPNECPYPHFASHANSSQVDYWGNDGHVVSSAEVMRHMTKDASESPHTVPAFAQWTDDEVLPLFEAPKANSGLSTACRAAAALGLIVVVLRFALSSLNSARSARNGNVKGWKAGAASLPMHY